MPVQATKRPVEIIQHGIKRTDPYAWMKAENWQEVMQDPSQLDTEIRAYLDEQNQNTDAFLSDTKELQETLFAELRGRIKEDDASVPQKDGDYLYSNRFDTGGQYPIFIRQKIGSDTPEIIYDGNTEAKGKAYFSLGGLSHSPNQKYLGIAVDTTGSEYYDLEVRDLKSKQVIDALPQISGDFEWCQNSKALIYTTLDESHRPSKVFLHRFGEDMVQDMLLFEENDPGFFVGLEKSLSGDYIFISTHQHDTSEIYVLDAAKPAPVSKPVRKRESGVEYDLYHHDDIFILRTNLHGAQNFKLMTTSASSILESNGDSSWRDLIAGSEQSTIVDLCVFKDFMVRLERTRALPRIVITRFDDGEEHAIEFEEQAYSLGVSDGFEYDTSSLRFTYTSPTSPAQVYDYNMETRQRRLLKEQVVPSGHKASDYVCQRFFAKSHDGLDIPVTVLSRRSTANDGVSAEPMPMLLYGYGSYGMSMPASFSTSVLSLVNRGFTYVIAHIRGGAEMGQAWYKTGRAEHKQNTFHDFISVAESLVDRGQARKGDIAIHGGSAGGMLVGAVVNMRPDLFKAVVAQVPFVDVLTTMSDTSLPLTPIEWPEWGNPIESEDAYKLIASYSPVDQVSEQSYPAILAIAGLTDPRVTYWEPAKWIATLNDHNQSDAPILLKTNMEAGHGGASGRFDKLKETALIYAFLLKVFGKSKGHT